MAKKKEVNIQTSPVFKGGFELSNRDKLNRVINGTTGREGKLEGGIGKNASDAEVLAHYDRLGGLIRKDGRKIAMGSFWDFENKCVRKEPLVEIEEAPNKGGLKIKTEKVGDEEEAPRRRGRKPRE